MRKEKRRERVRTMKVAYLAKLGLSKLGKVKLMKSTIIGGGKQAIPLIKHKIIIAVKTHVSLVADIPSKGELVTWTLTHDGSISKHGNAVENLKYTAKLISKVDYRGCAQEQYLAEPGLKWTKEMLEVTRTKELDLYYKTHENSFMEHITTYKSEGLIDIAKWAAENNELLMEATKTIG